MSLKSSSEFTQIENWLSMLIKTYKHNPSIALAKTINYYLHKLLHHDDIHFCGSKRCDYLIMQRFWLWQSNSK